MKSLLASLQLESHTVDWNTGSISYLERKKPGRTPVPVKPARSRRWDSSCRPSRSDLSSGWSWSIWMWKAHSLASQSLNIYSNPMLSRSLRPPRCTPNTCKHSGSILWLTCPMLRARRRPYWLAHRRRWAAPSRSHGNRNHIQGPACMAHTACEPNSRHSTH